MPRSSLLFEIRRCMRWCNWHAKHLGICLPLPHTINFVLRTLSMVELAFCCYVLFPPFNCQAYVCVCVRPHASISVPIHHHKICHIKNSVFQFIRRRFETSNTLQKELFGSSSLVLFVFFLLHQFTMRYFWMKLYMYSCAGVSGREARIGKEM